MPLRPEPDLPALRAPSTLATTATCRARPPRRGHRSGRPLRGRNGLSEADSSPRRWRPRPTDRNTNTGLQHHSPGTLGAPKHSAPRAFSTETSATSGGCRYRDRPDAGAEHAPHLTGGLRPGTTRSPAMAHVRCVATAEPGGRASPSASLVETVRFHVSVGLQPQAAPACGPWRVAFDRGTPAFECLQVSDQFIPGGVEPRERRQLIVVAWRIHLKTIDAIHLSREDVDRRRHVVLILLGGATRFVEPRLVQSDGKGVDVETPTPSRCCGS